MHNQIMGSIGMDQENHIAQDNSYGNENWVDMNSYHHHQTTMPEYESSFPYMPPITHGLPSESLNRMPPPPPPHSLPQSQTTHAQLPVLIMPHAPWPSMLTNPNYGSHPAPPVAIPPVTAPLKTSKLPAIQTTSQPRKTLTDDDRRRMCQYAKDHPTAKQTDIGLEFGVERSTVSKVLRNRDKYLNSEDRSSSPIKRNKGKNVDIEKALVNYLRNTQRTGLPVTLEDLQQKAQKFSTAMGSSADDDIKTNNPTYLEKLMSKHSGPGRLMRRASETNISDGMRGSPSLSASQPSSAISPASPSAHPSPSPLSANRSDEEKENLGSYMDFTAEGNTYKHSNSQSTTSLSSAFTDGGGSSFSGSALSPTASFNFSPDGNVGSFLTADQNRHIPPPGGAGFQRPRSQTFPTLDLEYMNHQQNTEPLTPKYIAPSTAPTSALESPANQMQGPHFGMDHAITSPQLRHSSSNSSITGRTTTTPLTASAVGSSPSSPTEEDTRRAHDTLLSIMHKFNTFIDQSEYLMLMRLTEKLRIHQAQISQATSQGMGGLSRIPESDSEMGNAVPVKEESAMGV